MDWYRTWKYDRFNLKNGIVRRFNKVGDKIYTCYWVKIGQHEIGMNNIGLARQLQLPCPKKVRKNSQKK